MDFKEGEFAKQGGIRPALIIQNSVGCKYSPIIWVIPFTSQIEKSKRKRLPMHILVQSSKQNNLKTDSILLVEQTQFVNRNNVYEHIGNLEDKYIYMCGNAFINNCVMFSSKITNVINDENCARLSFAV